MRLSIADIQSATAASCSGKICGNGEVTGVSTDSRDIAPGDLFICIRGDKFDGHSFALDALNSGASAIMIDRPLADEADARARELGAVLLVDDSVLALGRLALAWRMRSKAFVIGVTGTAGKTTVKEILSSILARKHKVARNEMNLNNQIGMPLSMLRADGDESFWVMEAGISRPEDMDELGEILKPDLALILNAGAGHLAGLGDKGTAFYKARLLKHLNDGGIGLVCADYPDLAEEAKKVCDNLAFFSALDKEVFYRATFNCADARGNGCFRVVLDGNFIDVEAPFRGRHGAENTIAIASAAHICGLDSYDIVRGFALAELPRQRCRKLDIGGWRIIDDSYNANPLSMARMLEAFSEMRENLPFICMLGEMGELGEAACEEHENLGRLLGRLAPTAVFWKGGHFEDVQAGFASEGGRSLIEKVENSEEFVEKFKRLGLEEGMVIVKGSRLNGLERQVLALKELLTASGNGGGANVL